MTDTDTRLLHDDGSRPWLTRAADYEWDDGDTTPRWECPECGIPLILESRCSECDWFDREKWDETIRREGLE